MVVRAGFGLSRWPLNCLIRCSGQVPSALFFAPASWSAGFDRSAPPGSDCRAVSWTIGRVGFLTAAKTWPILNVATGCARTVRRADYSPPRSTLRSENINAYATNVDSAPSDRVLGPPLLAVLAWPAASEAQVRQQPIAIGKSPRRQPRQLQRRGEARSKARKRAALGRSRHAV